MTYLYFSMLIFCLLTKTSSIVAIMCSMKNVMTISYNRHVVIRLGSLFSSFWHFWNSVDEVFSMLDISTTLHLCMVRVGHSKVWGDKYQMMCGITCFAGLVILTTHGCLPDGCLLDCRFNNIVEILDDKKPNVFLNTNYFLKLEYLKVMLECVLEFSQNVKKITIHQGLDHLNSPKVPRNGYKGATKNRKPKWEQMSQPHFGRVWGWSPTLPKLGIWSPPGLPNV